MSEFKSEEENAKNDLKLRKDTLPDSWEELTYNNTHNKKIVIPNTYFHPETGSVVYNLEDAHTMRLVFVDLKSNDEKKYD